MDILPPMKAWGALLGALVIVLLPASAVAKPGYFVFPAHRSATIHLRGSNGYRIEVQATAARSKTRSQIYVTAHNGPATVFYFAHGSLAADGSIDAHLPHVGRIALDFDPLHVHQRRIEDVCKGHPSVVERGYFRGTIQLHGERGFTTVDRSSAPGSVIHAPRHVCHYGTPHHGKRAHHRQAPFTSLSATREEGFLSFEATRDNFGFGVIEPTFAALAFRIRGGMGVLSSIYVTGKIGDFAIAKPGKPRVAQVSPPAPFEGSATFKLTSPKTSTWEGDLSVELPGHGRVQLAGPDFSSTLCEDRHCTDTAPKSSTSASDGSFFVVSSARQQLAGG
jgi:hypothetical protein